MSVAAFAVAETAIADSASKSVRKPPPKRQSIAKPDAAVAAEPR